MKNPYDWTRQNPTVEIPRPELAATVEDLLLGRSFILLAGRAPHGPEGPCYEGKAR